MDVINELAPAQIALDTFFESTRLHGWRVGCVVGGRGEYGFTDGCADGCADDCADGCADGLADCCVVGGWVGRVRTPDGR